MTPPIDRRPFFSIFGQNLRVKTYTCLVVDDEEIDRLTAVSFVRRTPELALAGVYGSAREALAFLEKNLVDVLILDIDMPGQSGFDLRRKAAEVPVCIFITAHPEHAVESFGLDTLDFIVKPARYERFRQAVDRMVQYFDLREKARLFEATLGGDTIYLKEGHDMRKVKLHDILYLEALKDYTKIVTGHGIHCVLSNLGSLLTEPGFASFLRTHRSFAVQPQYVEKVLPGDVQLRGGATVPVGRSYRESVRLRF